MSPVPAAAAPCARVTLAPNPDGTPAPDRAVWFIGEAGTPGSAGGAPLREVGGLVPGYPFR